MFLAIKELKKEKLRYGMILSVIVLISFLVYFLTSLAYGLAQLNRTSIDHWDAQGVIVSKASNNNILASQLRINDLEDIDGIVFERINITSSNISKTLNEETESLIFMGYNDLNSPILPPIIEGEISSNESSIVVSSNIRDVLDLEIGDSLYVSQAKRELTITGFTKDSNYNTVPVAYGSNELVSKITMLNMNIDVEDSVLSDMTSFLLVNKTDNIDIDQLNDNFVYLELDTLINALPGYTPQVLTFGLMIISLSIIASVIMGIFMFILTIQKKAIFAVLKIQGYNNSTVVGSILYQITALMLIGLSVGLILNQVLISLLPAKVPTQANMTLNLIVSILILMTSFIGALFSAYSVLKIDPMESL